MTLDEALEWGEGISGDDDLAPCDKALPILAAEVRAGMPQAAAARKHKIHRSSICRALQREASRCPTCGQVVKESRHVADD